MQRTRQNLLFRERNWMIKRYFDSPKRHKSSQKILPILPDHFQKGKNCKKLPRIAMELSSAEIDRSGRVSNRLFHDPRRMSQFYRNEFIATVCNS